MALSETRSSRPVGATIGLVFGGLWWLLGAQVLPAPWPAPAAALGFAVSAGLIFLVWRRRGIAGGGTAMFRSRMYIAAVALEVAAIALASHLVPPAQMNPAVGVIVGLHFIGLWMASGARRFLWIAAGMCAVSAASALLPPGPREAACGFGNALVLWVFAALA